ncbi:Aste57867_10973 [Aphanomyces stellatus]|uniref:Aste57867_10973 protein n=1 Tax=Aphanomyces stellatus TaxID=120398 RepID=A0A485KS95_9STRA|nr:hypothetical protein As57867_010932 [Aphanomyces stellatus]VFT87841.1 Aste57867_10973 [Aphanomyces stellatus]
MVNATTAFTHMPPSTVSQSRSTQLCTMLTVLFFSVILMYFVVRWMWRPAVHGGTDELLPLTHAPRSTPSMKLSPTVTKDAIVPATTNEPTATSVYEWVRAIGTTIVVGASLVAMWLL